MTLLPDLQIAQSAALKPLGDVAAAMGIGSHLLEPYGEHVAKIKLSAIDELAGRPTAKYVVVSAVTPTPLGEGKTTTTVGLGQALARIGRRATFTRSPRRTICSRRCWTTTCSRATRRGWTRTTSPGGGCSTSTTGCCAT